VYFAKLYRSALAGLDGRSRARSPTVIELSSGAIYVDTDASSSESRDGPASVLQVVGVLIVF
jgi:hypothetical protein